MPKLRIRVHNSHFPQVLLYTCFAGTSMKIHQNAQSRRCIQAKHKAKHIQLHFWAEHQRGRGPGLAKSPHAKGSGQASTPGCDRTHGAPTPPLAQPGPTLLRRCIQCTRRSVAWVLTKNTSPNRPPQAI